MPTRLTLPEAAAELRKSARWLREWLQSHPRDKSGAPYYTPAGRDRLFHPSDIARIELALREEVTCRSGSGRPVKARRRTSKSAAAISASAWNALAELTGVPSLASESATSKNASNSTDATRPRKLSLIQGGLAATFSRPRNCGKSRESRGLCRSVITNRMTSDGGTRRKPARRGGEWRGNLFPSRSVAILP